MTIYYMRIAVHYFYQSYQEKYQNMQAKLLFAKQLKCVKKNRIYSDKVKLTFLEETCQKHFLQFGI